VGRDPAAALSATTVWRNVRIFFLLVILAIAAITTLQDRIRTTSWEKTVWIGVFPINAEGDAATAAYIDKLTPERIADIEQFINREAHRYGVAPDRPVRVDLYPRVSEKPPPLARDANALGRAWWSLKLRLYARRASQAPGRAPPTIRVFVLYHDPTYTQSVPHSVGLQKGLVGVVHAFADASMTRTNNVVIAHEILHTVGATDKYDPESLAPIYPIGYAEPEREPRFPQSLTEIMAGRYAVNDHTFEMPETLADVRVGPATALEIRWTKPR
jgi:hypothetical protein